MVHSSRAVFLVAGIAAVGVASLARLERPPALRASQADESGARAVPLPTAAPPEGSPENKTILETGYVRVETLTVRRGQKRAPHSSEEPVLIHALVGSGKVVVDGKELRVANDSMVALAPGVEHAVESDGEDLVLLVEHLRVPGDDRKP